MSNARWFFPAAALCLSLSLSLSHAAQLISLDFTGARSGNSDVGESFAISADGRFAAFTGTSTNYAANDSNGISDVFVHDCVLRRHIWDTTPFLHYPHFAPGSSPLAFTPDGRYLLFSTTATNLVSGFTFTSQNMAVQLYVRDLVSNVTALVGVSYDGTKAANQATYVTRGAQPISSDGRFISFVSYATNLAHGTDTNGFEDLFCRDLLTGVTEVISLAPGNERTLWLSTHSYRMSTNGQFFTFENRSAEVIPGMTNTNFTAQVYWRDRLAGTNVLVSITHDAQYPAPHVNLRDMSSDGRYVCFQTSATNIVHDQNDASINSDLFIRDMFAGETWLVSRGTNGLANGTTGTSGGRFSANGQVLIFSATTANLVPGISDINGNNYDIFAHDVASRTNAIVSVSIQGNAGADGFASDDFASISPSGRFVLFTSNARNLMRGSTTQVQRLYLRDLRAGLTLNPLRSPHFPTPSFNYAHTAISDTDRYIFFMTQTNFDRSVTDANNGIDLFRAPLYQPKFLSARPMLVDALPNTTYVLQSSIDLRNWFDTFTNVSDANGQIIYNLHSSSLIHFHRLLWP